MTDRELKKLSRLELLEILLEESKENERLRNILDETEKKNGSLYLDDETAKLTQQLNCALQEANKLVYELKNISRVNTKAENNALVSDEKSEDAGQKASAASENTVTQVNKQSPASGEGAKNDVVSDVKLYCQIMRYYAANETALASLPADLQKDVRTRIRGIVSAGK